MWASVSSARVAGPHVGGQQVETPEQCRQAAESLRRLEGEEIKRELFAEVAGGLETYPNESEHEALAGRLRGVAGSEPSLELAAQARAGTRASLL
jgi:hypothetical protein